MESTAEPFDFPLWLGFLRALEGEMGREDMEILDAYELGEDRA